MCRALRFCLLVYALLSPCGIGSPPASKTAKGVPSRARLTLWCVERRPRTRSRLDRRAAFVFPALERLRFGRGAGRARLLVALSARLRRRSPGPPAADSLFQPRRFAFHDDLLTRGE